MTIMGGRQMAVVLAGVVILTALYFKTQAVDPERHNQIINYLREIKHLDATLTRDVLKMRSGALKHSDTLVSAITRMRAILNDFQEHPLVISGVGSKIVRQGEIAQRVDAYAGSHPGA